MIKLIKRKILYNRLGGLILKAQDGIKYNTETYLNDNNQLSDLGYDTETPLRIDLSTPSINNPENYKFYVGSKGSSGKSLDLIAKAHYGEVYSNKYRAEKGYSDCSSLAGRIHNEMTGLNNSLHGTWKLWKNHTTHITANLLGAGDLIFLTPKPGQKVEVDNQMRGHGMTTHVATVLEVKRNGKSVRMRVAESTGKQGSHESWYEVGDPTLKGNFLNYSVGNTLNATLVLGFGRWKK